MGKQPQAYVKPVREVFRVEGSRVRVVQTEATVWQASLRPLLSRRTLARTSFSLDPEHVVIGRIEAFVKRRHYASELLRALSIHYDRPVIPYLVDATEEAAVAFWEHLRLHADFVDTGTPWTTTVGT